MEVLEINIPIGIIKNCIPPQAESPNPKNIPPVINLEIAIFLFSDFIPLKKKYIPKSP